MGLLTIIKKQKLKDKEVRVLILGLDNSGKSTIVAKLLNDASQISPTIGFQIKTLQYKESNINFWDIGGQSTLRPFWNNYFDKIDVLIWVIDLFSLERIQESFQEFNQILMEQDRLVGSKILVLLNKCDLVDSRDTIEKLKQSVINDLQLDVLPQPYSIEPVSGITGENIESVLEFLNTSA